MIVCRLRVRLGPGSWAFPVSLHHFSRLHRQIQIDIQTLDSVRQLARCQDQDCGRRIYVPGLVGQRSPSGKTCRTSARGSAAFESPARRACAPVAPRSSGRELS